MIVPCVTPISFAIETPRAPPESMKWAIKLLDPECEYFTSTSPARRSIDGVTVAPLPENT